MGKSPSGLASSASSPQSEEPFCAGFAREKASSRSGEVTSEAKSEGLSHLAASVRPHKKLPAAEHRGQGKQNAEFYSATSPEISLMAETVAARFCMSLGTISLVALPSATFSMASMLRRAR